MSHKRIIHLLSVAVLNLTWLPMVFSQAPSAAPASSFEPLRPPTTDQEFQTLKDSLAGDIQALQEKLDSRRASPASEPDVPEKAGLATAGELLDVLRVYDALLTEYWQLRAQVRFHDSEQGAAQLSEVLESIQAQITATKLDLERWRDQVAEEELAQTEQDWEAAKTDLAARARAQEERDQRHKDAPARKESATKELEAKQAGLLDIESEYESKIAADTTDVERETAGYRVRKAQVEAGISLLQLERLELEQRRDLQSTSQAEQRLPVLRELTLQLERRFERLKQLKTRSLVQLVNEHAEYANGNQDLVPPYERAYWNLRFQMLRAQQEITALQRQLGIRDRFSKEALDKLKEDIRREYEYWVPLIDTVEGRAGDRIQDFYERIGTLVHARRTHRERVQAMYYDTLDDRARIVDRMEQLDDEEIAPRLARLPDLAATETNKETLAKLAPELKQHQREFQEEMERTRVNLNELAERLKTAEQLLAGHVEALAALRSRLYWSHLRVRNQPIWKFQTARFREEWDAERPARAKDLEGIRQGLEGISPTRGLWMAAIIAAALVFSAFLGKRMTRAANDLESSMGARMQDSEQTVASVSDRLHLQFIRFLARTSVVMWPAAAAWGCITFLSPLDSRVATPAIVMLLGAGVMAALISTLFSRSKPRFRLIPCSNVVALHYRRWLRVLLWASIIVLPVPVYLTLFGWAPYSRTALWTLYKVLALAIVLLFMVQRQMVLRVVGRPDHAGSRLLYLIVAAAYPLLYLLVVTVLIIQILGYGPLTNYVISGLARTVTAVILATLLVRYVHDLAEKYARRLGEGKPAMEPEGEGPATDRAAALAAGREVALIEPGERVDFDLWINLLSSLFRWTVFLCAVVIILGFWGVSQVDLRRWMRLEILAASADRPAVTIGRTLLAIAIVALSWVISRGVRSFLETRVFPTYGALDRGGRAAISTLLHYVLVLFGLYFALYTMRIPLGALTVVLGTVGLGLGLGLQPLFVNFLSGLVILFERHLKVGDVIEVNGVLGEVTLISLRATSVKTFDNVDMVIPNADFVSGKVINWTLDDPRLRGNVQVGVGYESDPRLVEQLLLRAARESRLVLPNPPPVVRFMNFGDSSLVFALYVWFNNVTDRWDFITTIRYRIMELFKENGIEIPYPQRTFSTLTDHPLRVQLETHTAPATSHAARKLPAPKASPETVL